ncbi:MAG TPA: hypothetical protein VF492_08720, partial [Verrucomicrobiae bacterium]
QKTADGWQVELPLAEVGWFKSKAYLLDEKNWQHWPDGSDVGVSVHPNFARSWKMILSPTKRTRRSPGAGDMTGLG